MEKGWDCHNTYTVFQPSRIEASVSAHNNTDLSGRCISPRVSVRVKKSIQYYSQKRDSCYGNRIRARTTMNTNSIRTSIWITTLMMSNYLLFCDGQSHHQRITHVSRVWMSECILLTDQSNHIDFVFEMFIIITSRTCSMQNRTSKIRS